MLRFALSSSPLHPLPSLFVTPPRRHFAASSAVFSSVFASTLPLTRPPTPPRVLPLSVYPHFVSEWSKSSSVDSSLSALFERISRQSALLKILKKNNGNPNETMKISPSDQKFIDFSREIQRSSWGFNVVYEDKEKMGIFDEFDVFPRDITVDNEEFKKFTENIHMGNNNEFQQKMTALPIEIDKILREFTKIPPSPPSSLPSSLSDFLHHRSSLLESLQRVSFALEDLCNVLRKHSERNEKFNEIRRKRFEWAISMGGEGGESQNFDFCQSNESLLNQKRPNVIPHEIKSAGERFKFLFESVRKIFDLSLSAEKFENLTGDDEKFVRLTFAAFLSLSSPIHKNKLNIPLMTADEYSLHHIHQIAHFFMKKKYRILENLIDGEQKIQKFISVGHFINTPSNEQRKLVIKRDRKGLKVVKYPLNMHPRGVSEFYDLSYAYDCHYNLRPSFGEFIEKMGKSSPPSEIFAVPIDFSLFPPSHFNRSEDPDCRHHLALCRWISEYSALPQLPLPIYTERFIPLTQRFDEMAMIKGETQRRMTEIMEKGKVKEEKKQEEGVEGKEPESDDIVHRCDELFPNGRSLVSLERRDFRCLPHSAPIPSNLFEFTQSIHPDESNLFTPIFRKFSKKIPLDSLEDIHRLLRRVIGLKRWDPYTPPHCITLLEDYSYRTLRMEYRWRVHHQNIESQDVQDKTLVRQVFKQFPQHIDDLIVRVIEDIQRKQRGWRQRIFREIVGMTGGNNPNIPMTLHGFLRILSLSLPDILSSLSLRPLFDSTTSESPEFTKTIAEEMLRREEGKDYWHQHQPTPSIEIFISPNKDTPQIPILLLSHFRPLYGVRWLLDEIIRNVSPSLPPSSLPIPPWGEKLEVEKVGGREMEELGIGGGGKEMTGIGALSALWKVGREDFDESTRRLPLQLPLTMERMTPFHFRRFVIPNVLYSLIDTSETRRDFEIPITLIPRKLLKEIDVDWGGFRTVFVEGDSRKTAEMKDTKLVAKIDFLRGRDWQMRVIAMSPYHSEGIKNILMESQVKTVKVNQTLLV